MSESLTRRTLLTGGVALGAVSLAPAVFTAPAEAATAAEQYVARVGKSILGVASGSGSVSQKKSKFRSLMRSNAAITTIGVFSLGRYKSKLKSSQRSEYFRLVEVFVAGLFIKYIKEFSGDRLEITGSKQRSSKEILVSSKVHFSGGRAPLDVRWRLIKSGGGYKIFDIRVLGIWLAIQQRTEFVSVIKKNNGDVGALLTFLRGS
ncbi:MAG: MlaC/ttg2D family ABC transporter substrate-binding protein [Hyphomicrobiales bacterium]